MARRCPHCNEELTYLKYHALNAGWESGTVDEDGDFETHDTGVDEAYEYKYACPECSHRIFTSDAYLWFHPVAPEAAPTETPAVNTDALDWEALI